MSLPPGFLDELRNRVSLSDVVGRKVMWDARKSNQGKGDMWAPCPFHHEKTASFHVDDRKGFYYCFGCHAKGDAISFIKDTENVGFMEAVEILAGEAGMEMPARDPQAQQKADRRTQLTEVMDHAVQFFRLQLKTGAAAEARTYLQKRGLKPETLERFEIGFAFFITLDDRLEKFTNLFHQATHLITDPIRRLIRDRGDTASVRRERAGNLPQAINQSLPLGEQGEQPIGRAGRDQLILLIAVRFQFTIEVPLSLQQRKNFFRFVGGW